MTFNEKPKEPSCSVCRFRIGWFSIGVKVAFWTSEDKERVGSIDAGNYILSSLTIRDNKADTHAAVRIRTIESEEITDDKQWVALACDTTIIN